MDDYVLAHLRITGIVQGVFFRASTREAAIAFGVSGWVRNLPDGSVEAVFEGPREAVGRAVAWTRTGPPHAVVERVDVEWGPPQGLVGFSAR